MNKKDNKNTHLFTFTFTFIHLSMSYSKYILATAAVATITYIVAMAHHESAQQRNKNAAVILIQKLVRKRRCRNLLKNMADTQLANKIAAVLCGVRFDMAYFLELAHVKTIATQKHRRAEMLVELSKHVPAIIIQKQFRGYASRIVKHTKNTEAKTTTTTTKERITVSPFFAVVTREFTPQTAVTALFWTKTETQAFREAAEMEAAVARYTCSFVNADHVFSNVADDKDSVQYFDDMLTASQLYLHNCRLKQLMHFLRSSEQLDDETDDNDCIYMITNSWMQFFDVPFPDDLHDDYEACDEITIVQKEDLYELAFELDDLLEQSLKFEEQKEIFFDVYDDETNKENENQDCCSPTTTSTINISWEECTIPRK